MDRAAAVAAEPLPGSRGSVSKRYRAALGYLAGAACLVWLFHDVRIGELGRGVGRIEWSWIALAIVFDVLGYVCQGWRWELLLRPAARVSGWRAAQAIYAGLFTNEILPMRVGELVRAYLVSRWARIDFSAVVPSMVVERFFDGVWLAVCIGLTAAWVPLPKTLLDAGDILGAAMVAGAALFLFLALRRGGHSRFSFLRTLETGIQGIGRSPTLYLALFVSLLVLASQILAFWLIMWGCGLRLPLWSGAAVLLIVRLGTAIPNAPANVGTYQFFTVLGLGLFGVEKTAAAGFSIAVFLLLTAPLWIIGLFAIARSGMTLSAIRAGIRQH